MIMKSDDNDDDDGDDARKNLFRNNAVQVNTKSFVCLQIAAVRARSLTVCPSLAAPGLPAKTALRPWHIWPERRGHGAIVGRSWLLPAWRS